MDPPILPGPGLPRLTGEWSAERWYRALLLPYGAAGRDRDELQTCPRCTRTYYRSNAGACPRCGGPVPPEPARTVIFPFGVG